MIETPDPREHVLSALMKEAELLRGEALACIAHVRQLALNSTYIAGFALPVIAGLFNLSSSQTATSAAPTLSMMIQRTGGAIQLICFGVCFTCVAILHIYAGSFLQIFTFAKYFREHLIPSFNAVVNYPEVKLFYWEDWLKANRKIKNWFIGDIDLFAEPVLISLYVLAYGAGFVGLGFKLHFFPKVCVALAFAILALTVHSLVKILKILRHAALDHDGVHAIGPSVIRRCWTACKVRIARPRGA